VLSVFSYVVLALRREGLAGSRALLNSKVFELRASFQFFSQPDGLRTSSGHCLTYREGQFFHAD
jgi:hypothetical protein